MLGPFCFYILYMWQAYKVNYSINVYRRMETFHLLAVVGFDCHRHAGPDFEGTGIPACDITCHNGGQVRKELDRCWCMCPIDWQGSPDCSEMTGESVPVPLGDCEFYFEDFKV